MIDTQKIRDNWKPEEKHEHLLIDCAISDIYKLCDELDKYRWRPVSKGLPVKPDKVHVLDIIGRIDTDIYNPEIERWGADVNYTHWMPIVPLEEGER